MEISEQREHPTADDYMKERNVENERSYTYPLTGERTHDEVKDRIVAVMVNNHEHARPQSGLSKADIVFEILAEGDITRFLALFQSDMPDVVGPVRSAREYYFKLAKKYDALYVFHGAANFVSDMINQQDIDHLDGSVYDNDGYLFKRESFRESPHNSYLQFDAVYKVAKDKGYYTTFDHNIDLPFTNDDITGEDVSHVEIAYVGKNPSHVVEYIYDEEHNVYMRYEDDEQTVDLETKEPLEMENVFIIETTHEVIDREGRRQIDLDTYGRAYLLQRGKLQEVEWQSIAGVIMPRKNGRAVGFVPGKTWINVVPKDPGIEQSVQIKK